MLPMLPRHVALVGFALGPLGCGGGDDPGLDSTRPKDPVPQADVAVKVTRHDYQRAQEGASPRVGAPLVWGSSLYVRMLGPDGWSVPGTSVTVDGNPLPEVPSAGPAPPTFQYDPKGLPPDHVFEVTLRKGDTVHSLSVAPLPFVITAPAEGAVVTPSDHIPLAATPAPVWIDVFAAAYPYSQTGQCAVLFRRDPAGGTELLPQPISKDLAHLATLPCNIEIEVPFTEEKAIEGTPFTSMELERSSRPIRRIDVE
jgi:hypothetical protein